jgi:hypothetical protein
MGILQERRLSPWSNATQTLPFCEASSSCRGRWPDHVHKEHTGSWEIPGLTKVLLCTMARIGKARSRSR